MRRLLAMMTHGPLLKGVTHHCNDQQEPRPCRYVGSKAAGPALALPGDRLHSLLRPGKEEEDEEEEEEVLCDPAASPPSAAAAAGYDDHGIVTAEEASEDLSVAPPSKPFLSLVKSLSSEVEPREGLALPPAMRHRQLMKTFVKSLSTDSSRADQEPQSSSLRGADSLLSLQLFRQFTQPRLAAGGGVGSDSKTAPSSPLASPDGRSFFKVQEVEARIEDTRRRLSEVMYEPLQRLSKMIGDDSGGLRPKPLSSSASELSSLAGLNGPPESNNNNNYCIKEEEGGDWEGESPPAKVWPSGRAGGGAWGYRSPSLGLDRCSMATLARQDDEEFCELYSDDFDYADADGEGEGEAGVTLRPRPPRGESGEGGVEEEEEEEEEAPAVPYTTLVVLTTLVYGCFVLPLPTYLSGALLGVAVGFMLAMLVVWLAGPRRSGDSPRRDKHRGRMLNMANLDIKEPDIFKGWMNEIYSYDPETYHATLTHSPKPDVTYISQKIYDLTDSKIYLAPQNLARKRVWNKKYPICIELGRQEAFMSQTQTGKGGAEEERTAVEAGERGEASGGSEEAKRPCGTPERSCPSAHVLFLFGRTGREKEEWFRRMTVSSKLKSEARKPQSLPGGRSAFIPSHNRSNSQSGGLSHKLSSSSVRQKMLLDYSVYMAQYVPPQPGTPADSPVHSAESSPGASKKLPSSPKEEAEPESWVNALLGRILWDFLGEKYWASVVSKKIQMKLSKIRLPYFMNELTLTELDMGVAVPKIVQASKPLVDHQDSGLGKRAEEEGCCGDG
ncbi:hypothetical protein AAFF_G00340340 [Aldrovandia affinis]|uniref:SMP-LTD domain-containing protein n=1 Tax=Aldrovandia affinis TaxID=143900 RepID=A0AAD7WP54_9TELE|nr:hypothetical protein AAFF_G00340340 [Aldrovandia affinis]